MKNKKHKVNLSKRDKSIKKVVEKLDDAYKFYQKNKQEARKNTNFRLRLLINKLLQIVFGLLNVLLISIIFKFGVNYTFIVLLVFIIGFNCTLVVNKKYLEAGLEDNWKKVRKYKLGIFISQFGYSILVPFMAFGALDKILFSYVIWDSMLFGIFNGICLYIYFVDKRQATNKYLLYIGDISNYAHIYGLLPLVIIAFYTGLRLEWIPITLIIGAIVSKEILPKEFIVGAVGRFVISVFEPIDVKITIKAVVQDIEDKLRSMKKAAIEIEKQIGKGNIGYLLTLRDTIDKQVDPTNKKRKKIFTVAIISFSLYILNTFVQSISEGVIQDLYLKQVQELLCYYLNIC